LAGIATCVALAFISDGQFKKAAIIYNLAYKSQEKALINFGLTKTGGIGLSLFL